MGSSPCCPATHGPPSRSRSTPPAGCTPAGSRCGSTPSCALKRLASDARLETLVRARSRPSASLARERQRANPLSLPPPPLPVASHPPLQAPPQALPPAPRPPHHPLPPP